MNTTESISAMDAQRAKSILAELVRAYLEPAFGVLPKKEIDLLFFTTLEQIGYISEDSTLYDLVQKLKVTRSKARNLLYDRELRRIDTKELDAEIKKVLKNPILQKEGDIFLFEVEKPLVLDHFKERVRKLGYLTDGSFSPGIVRLSLKAVVSVIDSYLSKTEKEQIKKALIRAGMPDNSFIGILKAAFKQLGKKIAQDAGESILEKAGDFISPFIEVNIEKISAIFSKTGKELKE